ncbi:hypothetical protein PWT90_05592 [Aphanocladium album]|nr:hypothetical protein PWT90_05592 [Aphanocladium album]
MSADGRALASAVLVEEDIILGNNGEWDDELGYVGGGSNMACSREEALKAKRHHHSRITSDPPTKQSPIFWRIHGEFETEPDFVPDVWRWSLGRPRGLASEGQRGQWRKKDP